MSCEDKKLLTGEFVPDDLSICLFHLFVSLLIQFFVTDPGAGFDDEKSLLMSQMSLEKRFGQSAVFVASTLMENGGVPQSATPETLLKEAIHVISCGYEDKTEWGSEVSSYSYFLFGVLWDTQFLLIIRTIRCY